LKTIAFVTIACVASSARSSSEKTVPAEVMLRIPATSANGDPQFTHISSATRLTNGNLVIADVYDGQVYLFDKVGKRLKSLALKGDGPGEFATPRWVSTCGRDTLYVLDDSHKRMQVYAPTGTFVRDFPVGVSPAALACGPDGTIVTAVNTSAPESANAVVRRGSLILFGANGDERSKIAGIHFSGPDRLLGDMIRVAYSGRSLFYGSGDSAVLQVRDVVAPNKLRTFDAGIPGRTPTAEQRAEEIEELSTRINAPVGMLGGLRKMYAAVPTASVLPACAGLYCDPNSKALWVATSFPGSGKTELTKFDLDGRKTGEAVVPLDLRIFEIRSGILLGSERSRDTGEQALVVVKLPVSRQ